ncbi:MAG: hypothetical protein U0V87_00615 [Acidobacteriota bacterium]
MKGRSMAVAFSYVADEMIETKLPLLERLEKVTREDLQRMEATVTSQVAMQAIDDSRPAVKLHHAGRTIVLQPIDTRRFVLAMAPHVCFN